MIGFFAAVKKHRRYVLLFSARSVTDEILVELLYLHNNKDLARYIYELNLVRR